MALMESTRPVDAKPFESDRQEPRLEKLRERVPVVERARRVEPRGDRLVVLLLVPRGRRILAELDDQV